MASPLSTMGRRQILAGVGAAASLVAAVIAIALVGPGIVGFDAGRGTPAGEPSSRSLRFGGSVSTARAGGSAGPRGPDADAATPAARSAPAADAQDPTGARRVERVAGATGGTNISATGPRPGAGGATDSTGRPTVTGPTEPVARGVEQAGDSLGRGSESLGSSASAPLTGLNPFLGQAAGRTGAESGKGARRAGAAAGGFVRGLAPPPQPSTNPQVRVRPL